MAEREPAILRGKTSAAPRAPDHGPDHGADASESAVRERSAEPAQTPAAPARSVLPARAPGRPGGESAAPIRDVRGEARPHRAARARKERPAPTFYVAGFWRRMGAAAIDLAVIAPVWLLLSLLVGALADIHLPPSRHHGLDFWLDLLLVSDPALIGGGVLLLAIAAVYALVFQIVLGRTPGMRVLRIRIIDHYGDPPATGRAAVRTVGYLAATATLGLGFLWIGFDSEKRGLHDWLSGTFVVRA